jgi:hypothetical protein
MPGLPGDGQNAYPFDFPQAQVAMFPTWPARLHSMRRCQERDTRIRQMGKAGASRKEIASAFGMSVKAVGLVFRKIEAEEAAIRMSRDLLQEFRRADDPDKRWKVADVLDALLLMTTTTTALRWWFDGDKIEATSLRGFMELVISERRHAELGYLIAPLLDIRCVGVKGFWSAVRRLTELDLGPRCNQEWSRRIARLRRASRIVGDRRYTWSKPCEPPAWLSKLASEGRSEGANDGSGRPTKSTTAPE